MAIRDLLPATRSKRHVPVSRKEDWSSPIFSLQREMNNMFDRFFNDLSPARLWDDEINGRYLPRVDIKETGREVCIEAELPGMDEKDIDISLSGNMLTLRGEKKVEREEKDEGFYHVERSYGKFHRDIPLPAEVETGNVEAVFKKGILSIHIPKKPESQQKSKRIEIKKG